MRNSNPLHRSRPSFIALAFFASLGIATALGAQESRQSAAPAAKVKETAEATKFSRFETHGERSGRLQTAVVTYRDGLGRTIDLVGAVHIADSGYYRRLNRLFEDYDALLYEMVKPKDAVIRKGESGDSIVSSLQRTLQEILKLSYQLDVIDYQAPNFVHADLTTEELDAVLERRGESMWTMLLDLFLTSLKNPPKTARVEASAGDLLQAFFSSDRADRLKYFFAASLEDMESVAASFGQGSVIIHERNKVCFETLERELSSGKKAIGIFYGAAHLPDLESRLQKSGFKKTRTRWITAWKIGAEPKRA